MFYQFLIYDTEAEVESGCYNIDGVIIEVSQLYKTKEECENAAISNCEEYTEEYDSEKNERFKYVIQKIDVVE